MKTRKRISLGMKQLQAHPWEALAAEIEIGSRVKGKVVNVADYGAFLEIMPGCRRPDSRFRNVMVTALAQSSGLS
jgi:ribosomal protein S1